MNTEDDLEGRDGLPHDLRVLAELYPRADWTAHANFNELTAFWLDRHGMFRKVIGELTEKTQGMLDGEIDPMRYGAVTSRYTGFFLDGLHGHHTIEDHHYFPQLAPLDSRVVRAFDLLDRDHHALDHHMRALANATNAVLRPLQEGKDTRDVSGKLLETQEDFSRFLHRHLEDEEEIVVPLILEYGPDIH
ncbi:hemerythrin domain-containing protein [Maritimibacter dapengensis]|uniref:Hemerythrin domain-containing protein n=1 Tax=Maritimibacter dapengensis TaxID=2836868 RepID=A0ABS6T047_9RHOB|nr:hemerythrin domain-containing protein [Maritimibacter dapengensis]MBV7378613.1 hemerythrin domain-containing protein [Maritimibacter dapengensis]